MRTPSIPNRNERGIALVVALLVLLSLSLVSVVFFASMQVEAKLTGHSLRESQAIAVAMAGIEEAKVRIASGDIPNNVDPDMVAQIFNVPAGSVPVLGADSVGLQTLQPAGQWLDYSKPKRHADVLTVKYKKNAANQVLRYDEGTNPHVQTVSGQPIFVITSTGEVGTTKRHIEAEYIRNTVPVNMKAAAVANKQIQNQEFVFMCGYDHLTTTPTWTAIQNGRNGAAGACNEGVGQWEGGGAILGGWAGETVQQTSGATSYGQPTPFDDNMAGFYNGPWETLLMTQTDFWTLMGTRSNTVPVNLNGIRHIDNNGTHGDQSGSWTINGGSGQGILYLDGSLTIYGDFTYRGLIYAEKQVQVQGRLWVLGAVVSREGIQIQSSTRGSAILFSEAMISQAISGAGASFVRLAWREY